MRQKVFSIFALLLLAATGAWAQSETLLTTIDSNDGPSVEGIATVEFSGEVENDGYGDWGWYRSDSPEVTITVTAVEGYTITRVKFYTASGSAFDEKAPFEAIIGYDGDWYAKVNGISLGEYGVNKIEVYGYQTPVSYSATWDAADAEKGKWTVSPTTLDVGETVTATYSGSKHVKSVKYVLGATPYSLSSAEVGMIVGSDGKAYAAEEKDKLPASVTVAGMVAYKSGSHGLVIALTDKAGDMDWDTANGESGAAAHTPVVAGQTWRLPSKGEWESMFSANGGDAGKYTGLNTAIENVGGTGLEPFGIYWSSSSEWDNYHYVAIINGNAMFSADSKEKTYKVRAVFAF